MGIFKELKLLEIRKIQNLSTHGNCVETNIKGSIWVMLASSDWIEKLKEVEEVIIQVLFTSTSVNNY